MLFPRLYLSNRAAQAFQIRCRRHSTVFFCGLQRRVPLKLVRPARQYHRVISAIPASDEKGQRNEPRLLVAAGGRRTTPAQRCLRDSHTARLQMWFESMGKPVDHEKRELFFRAAGDTSFRPPLVALQASMMEEESRCVTHLSKGLPTKEAWKAKVDHLASKGITMDDIKHWNHILAVLDADVRVERFISSDRFKPIYVLFCILRREAKFKKPRSFMAILRYVTDRYCNPTPSTGEPHLPFGTVRRSLNSHLNMTPMHFELLMTLLVHHCISLWPSAMVAVARSLAQYIENISDGAPTGDDAVRQFKAQCSLFNKALALFARLSLSAPFENTRHNWRAQKVLLSMSTRCPRALILDRGGFRAIRRVLIALRKSVSEQNVAVRLSPTWPPYRQDWDGTDERRQPEDDHSRSVQAGTLMHEGGYASDSHDVALGVLGGAELGQSPYIQTRSLSPRVWSGKLAYMNLYTTWAAQVKATRNAHEAWHMFRRPPIENLRPNTYVYAEMFAKLLAREVNLSATTLPGDMKETLPVHDANLSEFERLRLRPPSSAELYGLMMQDNLRPTGYCLAILAGHAMTFQDLGQILRDSTLDQQAVQAFLRSINRRTRFNPAEAAAVRKMPLDIFNTCISSICNMQPHFKPQWGPTPRGDIHRLRNTISLALFRFKHEDPADHISTWHVILRALSRPNIAVSMDFDTPPYAVHNRMAALKFFIRVFRIVRDSNGVDLVMFDRLCLVLRRVLKFDGSGDDVGGAASSAEDLGAVREAHMALKAAFAELTQPTRAQEDLPDLPALFHALSPIHVQNYVRTLGYLNDIDEMVRVVEWVIDSWGEGSVFEDARDANHSHHARVMAAFTVFRAFADDQISPEKMSQLEARLKKLGEEQGCTWNWPSQNEVDGYIEHESKKTEMTQKFWAKARGYMDGHKEQKEQQQTDVLTDNR